VLPVKVGCEPEVDRLPIEDDAEGRVVVVEDIALVVVVVVSETIICLSPMNHNNI